MIYYSNAHLVELNESSNSDKDVLQNWIDKRLKCIKKITNDWLIDYEIDSDEMILTKRDPRNAFNKLYPDNILNSRIKSYSNQFSHELRNIMPKILGLKKGDLNDLKADEVAKLLNDNLAKLGGMKTIFERIDSIPTFSKSIGSERLLVRISGIFEFLDLFGYWSDRQNRKSNFARILDSNHCFYAAYSDFFITNDKKTRMKSNLVYEYCNLRTRAIDIQKE